MKHRSNRREDSARINIFVLYSFNEPPFLKRSGRPRHLLIISSPLNFHFLNDSLSFTSEYDRGGK